MTRRWMATLAAAALVSTVGLVSTPSASGSTEPESKDKVSRSTTVRDPRGDVDTDRGSGGWPKSVDVHRVTYKTYWKDGRRMLRVLIKVRNALGENERPQTVSHELYAIEPRGDDSLLSRTITVVHYESTMKPLVWSTYPGGFHGIKVKRVRAWANTRKNIIGLEMSTERFGPNRSIRGSVTVSTPAREGRNPRDVTAVSKPFLR